MNKQELIEYCESLKGDLNKFINGVEVDKIIKGIEQLDEPQKPVVPQYIAEWIDYCKMRKISLAHALYRLDESVDKRVFRWVVDKLDNQETFAKAWLFGYEVEKEKRYTVKLKNTNDYLNQTEVGFHFYDNCRNNGKFTRKEIEDAGFGEVFNCPLFEVEEV